MYTSAVIGPPRIGIPPSEYMIPGETYVGVPPGHTRPAFVRKRPVDSGRPPWFLTNIFGSSRRAYTVGGSQLGSMFSRSSWRDRYDRYGRDYYPHGLPYTNRYNPQVSFARPGTIHDTPLGPVAAKVNQVCRSCGRYRSASWQARHPLAPGESGSSALCRRCENKRSSSDDYETRHHRRSHHHRRSRRYTDSTDDGYYDREHRRPSQRYFTGSRDNRSRRSSSRGSVRVVIANQIGDRQPPVRHLARSSSVDDGVRLIRREEVVDIPERRILSKSRQRTFSGESDIEDGGRYIENLERRTYYAPPRRSSRTRYVDKVEVPRYRSRRRSSSHVVFADEMEEPIIVPRPRRLSRRRSMHFDGAADVEDTEHENRDPSRSTSRVSRSTSRFGGVQLVEEAAMAHSCPGKKAIEADKTAQLTEGNFKGLGPPYYESDHDESSRSRSQSAQRPESLFETPRAVSHHRTYSPTPKTRSRTGSHYHDDSTNSSPQRQPRRRYRDTDVTSDTDAESTCTPSSYRHVRAPTPPPRSPSPCVDYLAGMLANAQITPPGDQDKLRDLRYARGRASKRYEDTPPPSAEYDRSKFEWDNDVDGAEQESVDYGYEPAERNHTQREEYDKEEYPWMEEQRQGDEYNWMD